MAHDEAVVWNVARDHGRRPDTGIAPDRHVARDYGARTDRGAAAYGRPSQPFIFARVSGRHLGETTAPRVTVVREDGTGTDEHVILDRHPFPDHRLVLDDHAVTDLRTAFDEGVITDITLAADDRTVEHVREGPDASALAYLPRFTDAARMDKHAINDIRHDGSQHLPPGVCVDLTNPF